jgi:hypothetical protein
MAHGLGRMQRMIIEALEPSKRLHAAGNLNYRGGYFSHSDSDEPSTISQGHTGELPLDRDWYDARAVKALVVRAIGEPSPSLDVAFSRALRSLLKRGVLERASNAGFRELRFLKAVEPPGEVTIPELRNAIARSENRLANPPMVGLGKPEPVRPG